MEQPQKSLNLLPNYYKKVGLGVFVFTLFIALPSAWFLKQSAPQLLSAYKTLLPTLFMDLLIVGLGLYAFSKDKVEDELITLLRLESMAYAFSARSLSDSFRVKRPVHSFLRTCIICLARVSLLAPSLGCFFSRRPEAVIRSIFW